MALFELCELSPAIVCRHTVEDVDFFEAAELCDRFVTREGQ
jgi:hypothetical protein